MASSTHAGAQTPPLPHRTKHPPPQTISPLPPHPAPDSPPSPSHSTSRRPCRPPHTRVHRAPRSDEILDWLHRHEEVTHFVVLDDVDLCYEDPSVVVPDCVLQHCLYTDEARGLLPKDGEAALAMLDIRIDRSKLTTPQLMPAEVSATPEAMSVVTPPISPCPRG